MELERYALNFDTAREQFEFTSEGRNGSLRKLIVFQRVHQKMPFYNLAFGDKKEEAGKIDDLTVSNNGDTDKVLATIIQSLNYFFEEHLYAVVFAQGSTKARTRLY